MNFLRALLVIVCGLTIPLIGANEVDNILSSEVQFAMDEIRGLSDSGVYETLSLAEVLSSAREDGTYHSSTALMLALESPHFKSGKSVETFEMMVLTHKEDGVKSLAIDEFPQMSDTSVEEFLIKKTMRKREEREYSFRLLEAKALLMKQGVKVSAEADLQTLLASLDSEDQMAERSRQSLATQKQLTEPFISQEKKLSTLSLVQLYDVSLNHSGSEVEWSDYQVERARNVLDSTLAE